MTGPCFEKRDQDGYLALRAGLVFALYFRNSHRDVAERVGRVLGKYVQFVGADALKFTHVGEEMRPLTEKRWARELKELTAQSRKKWCELTFASEDAAAPEYKFTYEGCDLVASEREYGNTTEMSFIEAVYANSIVETRGCVAIVGHFLELSSLLPASSGYASLALNWTDSSQIAVEQFAWPLAKRHPGLDLHDPSATSFDLHSRVRNAYWLTILGHEQLAALKLTPAALRERLGPEILVHDLPHGVAIQAGEAPELGDVNRGERLPLVRKVAKVIEPILYRPHAYFGAPTHDDFVEWERRHLL